MTNWLERAILKRLSTANSEQYGWLYSTARRSPGVFWKLLGFFPLATHRKRTNKLLIHLARLGAMRVYDCGSCLQIAVDTALEDGIAADTLRDAMTAPEVLSFDPRLAVDFGAAVARNDAALPGLITDVRGRFGEAVLAELALAAATAAVLPTLKRGIGAASACEVACLRFSGAPVWTQPQSEYKEEGS